MALTAQQEAVVAALAGHANLAQFSAFMDALTPANWQKLVDTVADAAQAKILAARERARPDLVTAVESAEAALNAVQTRLSADLSVAQYAANEAANTVNASYAAELAAARQAVAAAQAALDLAIGAVG